jgi:hypothetical protein
VKSKAALLYQEQLVTARRLGYEDDVAQLNFDHDRVHEAMCRWLGIRSLSLAVAAGEQLSEDEHYKARIEETAALAVQHLIRVNRLDVRRLLE